MTRSHKKQNQKGRNPKPSVAAAKQNPTTQPNPNPVSQPTNRLQSRVVYAFLVLAFIFGFGGPLLLGYWIKLNSVLLTYCGYASAGVAAVLAFVVNVRRANSASFKWTEGAFSVFCFMSLAVAYHVGQSEANQTNEETKASYEKTIKDNKAHYEDTIAEIKKSAEETNKAIYAVLTGDEIWNTFPSGYVLFVGQGKDREIVPLVSRAYDYPVANWKETEIVLDPAKKTFQLTLAGLEWKKADGTPGNIRAIGNPKVAQLGSYEIGKPVIIGVIHVAGQLNPYLEVMDDNPNHPICVIGFRK